MLLEITDRLLMQKKVPSCFHPVEKSGRNVPMFGKQFVFFGENLQCLEPGKKKAFYENTKDNGWDD
jgi:hypothetical protein